MWIESIYLLRIPFLCARLASPFPPPPPTSLHTSLEEEEAIEVDAADDVLGGMDLEGLEDLEIRLAFEHKQAIRIHKT